MIRAGVSVLALITILAALSIPSPAEGDYIESVEEITAGNFLGFGARQMAMGGAGMMSIDGTALYYNPANLARIPRIEFNFGLTSQKYTDESNVRKVRKMVNTTGAVPTVDIYAGRFEDFTAGLSSLDDSRNNTRINSAILSIPYPTYRGSLVVGIGVVRTADFDRTFRFTHRDRHAIYGDIIAAGSEFQSGGLHQWSAGIGMDLSPRVSFGVSISMYTGKHEYNFEYDLDSASGLIYHSEQFIEDSYLGFGAKLGLAMQISPNIGLGLAVESPVTLSIDEDVHAYSYELNSLDGESIEDIYYSVEYNVKKPFAFSAGLLIQRGHISLVADIDYADWSQLEYGDNIIMEEYNDKIKDYYHDVLRSRVGAEAVLPNYGLSLRAGLFSDPLPYNKSFQNKSRQGYTLGVGLLVDQVMTIDVAYVHGSYSRNSDFYYGSTDAGLDHYLIIDEDISYNRIFLTAAYRF